MNFHLQFPISPFSQKINYSNSFLFLGSCFAENMGDLMSEHKFKIILNPHGVLYNPSSIAVALRRYMKIDFVTEDELFFANDCWNSLEHHSRFSNPDKQVCLTNINKSISEAHTFLKNTDWLFITFGSAYVYKKNERLVGNCHKQTQKEFAKSMLSVSEMGEEYKWLVKELLAFNPKLKIVFTISPVRYVRDGVVENNLSKSRLIETVHQLTSKNVFYFPAYELMMDDLRDYRFYKEDLVHPNEQAINYVFEKFVSANFDETAIQLLNSIKEIIAAKNHKPFHLDTDSHKKFKVAFLERCKKMQLENPGLNLKEEINYFGK